MILYRASKSKYSKKLSGEGAKEAGGRWNSKGIPIIYTAENEALCQLETLAHFNLTETPNGYKLISIYAPDTISTKTVQLSDLPKDWNSIPYKKVSQKIGDELYRENKYLLLKVPSVSAETCFNCLINPDNPEFKKIKIMKIEDFGIDKRLIHKVK